MAETPLTLVDIAKGGAVELFDRALEQVVNNIADVNTDAEASREIVLRFKFKPNKDRTQMPVHISASTKLASVVPAATYVYVGRARGGKLMAVESNPEQLSLTADVTPIRGVPSQEK